MQTVKYNRANSVHIAYKTILKDLLESGNEVIAGKSLSTGSQKTTREILNYTITIDQPTKRLVHNSVSGIWLAGAVSRFIWMMAANNRIKDIEFYWGKGVSNFSDDEITMPGSNYGSRMFTPRPGLNQIESIIQRLRNNHATRRATISIFHPEDAVRESKDIPCAFGISFHLRNGILYPTIIMRSNNASFLLPYNLFEFSLLSEVIACEVGVPLGSLNFTALSMHIYEKDYTKAQKIIESSIPSEDYEMNLISKNSKPLENINNLVKLEADLRHASHGISIDNIDEWIKRGEDTLDEYWQQFYFVLVHFILEKKITDYSLADKIKSLIKHPWNNYLPDLDIQEKVRNQKGQKDLFGQDILESESLFSESIYTKRLQSFEKLCQKKSKDLIKKGDLAISFEEYEKLRNILIGSPFVSFALVARNLSQEISEEDFDDQFSKIR